MIKGGTILDVFMNMISTCSFACVAAAVYKHKHTKQGAMIGLLLGVVITVINMTIWNYIVTPIYYGMPRAAVVALLLPGIIPFNILKAGLNAGITLFVYKSVVAILRHTHFIEASGQPTSQTKSLVWVGPVSYTHLPVHIVLNCIDLSILVLQFTFNDTTHVIYGIMIVMITAVVLNKTLTQGTSLVQLTVISDEYETIKESILHEFDAGVTLLASEKGYTKENSKLILSVLPYRKLPSIKAKIHEIDPYAFVIVSHVEEVGGKGFTLEKRNA